ncbi:acyl-CoA N-acyltransferase [Calocera viscosa TUFC12733]|uniref:Acyl-CoA N-acyltransferase n=1 Tax=Calocera viscosa (strain TUFC12733) TaxID=1330018 RepID=A0A167KGT9_CALVF|nr:acyl-CoA N-acyltransferase [Calocera viscosa TUFC12733]
MAFATTKHLKLRAMRDSDHAYFDIEENDQRVMRTTFPGYIVPKGGSSAKEQREKFLSSALLLVIIEVKKEYTGLRKWDEDEERKENSVKKAEDWDRELFGGFAVLHLPWPKNREASFGISILTQWWGNGFATEVTEWVVQHGFEQLNLHRISLNFFGTNGAAKRVYEKCGFVHEGLKKKVFWLDGQWVDEGLMGIVDEDYLERKKALASKS